MTLTLRRVAALQGSIRPPSDKSLTHRAYMLAACATSPSVLRNPLAGADCQATLRCLQQMGLGVDGSRLIPASSWSSPEGDLDCGNSGTSMRLLAGLIASRPLAATLVGDESLSRRPMGRVATPLRLMGAEFAGEKPPLRIRGGSLRGIRYESPVASAQVKSAILLAGLRADGETAVIEESPTRDHTERMLAALGVEIRMENGESPLRSLRPRENLKRHAQNHAGTNAVALMGGQSFEGFEFSVPRDISSAAFWMVAAALSPGSEVVLSDVGVNPTRTGILDVFEQIGIKVSRLSESNELGEPVADLLIRTAEHLRPFEIKGSLVPRLIDEIPVLAVLATQCDGISRIRDAKELRVKESDRIERVADGLRKMGAKIAVVEDGMDIEGPVTLQGAVIDSEGDHRIGMAFAIAGIIADGETTILNSEHIASSYPDFEKHLWSLAVV